MKGIVFTEFLEMVEQKFGYEVVDKIISESKLESNGIYTSIGTYHHSEIISLVTNLSESVQIPANDLIYEFGKYLFDTFLKNYPVFFTSVDNAFDFLGSIDNHIHVEVKKLYPDATLPKFDTFENEDGHLIMTYKSERKMAALAKGLIEKSIDHYNEDCSMEIIKMNEEGSIVKFILKRK